jgi:hypothetical protein
MSLAHPANPFLMQALALSLISLAATFARSLITPSTLSLPSAASAIEPAVFLMNLLLLGLFAWHFVLMPQDQSNA